MRELKRVEISNELDNYLVTHEDIEAQIRNYPLQFFRTRNRQVEWGMQFPMFVPSFYSYIANTKGTLPSQEQYWKAYQDDNSQWFNDNSLSDELMHGLKARIYRTYPSLCRDIHFAKYLQTTLKEIEVIYDMRLDIEEGIDILLIRNDALHAINLYTDTRRAYTGRHKKSFRHKNYSNVNYVELPVAFQGSVQVGDFYLYGKRERQQILNSI